LRPHGSPFSPAVDTERYDLNAQATGDFGGAPPGQLPPRAAAMLWTMLADRFQLKARTETQERPIFELVTTHPDKALGERLEPSKGDCYGIYATSPPPTQPPCPFRGVQQDLAGRGPAPSDYPLLVDALPEQLNLKLERPARTGRGAHRRTCRAPVGELRRPSLSAAGSATTARDRPRRLVSSHRCVPLAARSAKYSLGRYASQFSTLTPGTRLNSVTLAVTHTASIARAIGPCGWRTS
jgi:hypothetical protein